MRARLLVLVFLGALGVCSVPARAVDPLSPPLVTTPAWRDWYDALLAQRLGECPRERPVTYHFSADGNDLTGDGSEGNPFQSLGKAQAIVAASPQGNYALLFRRGDIWRMPASATANDSALLITAPNVTVADYGTGTKPVLTAFRAIDPALWQPEPGSPPLFSTLAAPDTTWVKDALDPFEPFIQTFSLVECQNNPRSFFYEPVAGRLYVHPPAGHPDPRTGSIAYEATRPTSSGVRLRGDGSRVENMVCFGFGMWFTTPSQMHGIDLWVTGTNRAVAVGCESYYGSTHLMVHAASGASGGIVTMSQCQAGFATPSLTAGETIFNAFSQSGGHQIIFDRCVARFGRLPSTRWNFQGTSGSRSFFSHIGGSGRSQLAIAYKCESPGGPWGCVRPVQFNGAVNASTLDQVRAFVVEERFVGARSADMNIAMVNTATINGRYTNLRPDPSAPFFTADAINGWAFNSLYQLDLTGVTQNLFAFYDPDANQQSRGTLLYNHYDITTRPGMEFRMDRDNPNRSFFMTFANNIVSTRGGGAVTMFRGFVYPTMSGNAYFGVDPQSFVADPTGKALSTEPELGAVPTMGGGLFLASDLAAQPRPDLDASGWVGPRASIGPLENTDADIDGNGRIDVEDLYAFVASPRDMNGDGQIDATDRRIVRDRVRWGERYFQNDPNFAPWRAGPSD